MTVSTTTIKNTANGNGSTSAFAYTFKIADQDHIKVYIRTTATGAEALKTLTTHYTVSGVGSDSGGSVTFTSGNIPTSAQQVVLRRLTPQTQSTDYVENDPFGAAVHEDALDKLTHISQEVQEGVDRSFTFPLTYSGGASTEMPEPVANAYVVWNADADALTTSTTAAAQFLGTDGTASLPFYSFTDDSNSGIYRPGSDNVAVSVGGSKVVDITSTGINSTAIGATTAAAGTFSSITSGGDIISDTDSTDSLGSTGVRWLKAWVDSIQTTADIDVGANLIVAGNLTVNGSTVTNSVTNQVIADPLIELNNGAGSNANDLGMIFERGSTGDNGFMGWDESGDYFTVGTTSATGSSTGNITYSFAPFKCSAITATSGTLAGITSLGLNAGATITAGILDEDAMGSDSAVALATQQSIKAYVDNSAPENGVKFAFESTTTDTDQGAGKVWLNNGTPSSATVLYVDDVEAGGVSVNAWVDTWDDVSNSVARGYIYIASYGTTNAILVYKVTGSVVSASTYSKVPVSHILTVGTISDGDSIVLTFVPSGADGAGDMSDVVDDTSPVLGGDLDVGGNDITSASNADVDINPNGTGNVVLKTDLVSIGGGSEVGHISSNSTQDLKLSTNSATNSGTIIITDGANEAITLTPNGTGVVDIQGSMNPSISSTGKAMVLGF